MFFDLRYACQEQPETKGIFRLDQLLDGERVGELKRASLEDAPVIAIPKAAHHVRVVFGQFCLLQNIFQRSNYLCNQAFTEFLKLVSCDSRVEVQIGNQLVQLDVCLCV